VKASLKHKVASERGRGWTQVGRQKSAENSKKEVQDKPRALDLFCGTKSVTKTLEDLGYEVLN
jgi:thymidylate synthase ThyX